MLHPTPYLSQWDDDAHLARGDCGIVAACMIARGRGIVITPDQMLTKAGLPIGKHSYTFGEVISAGRAAGLELQFRSGATWDVLQGELMRGNPTITLLRYGKLSGNQDDFDGSHFVTVVGFDGEQVIVNDPNWWGERREEGRHRRISLSEFKDAIGEALLPTGNQAYQSLFVAAEAVKPELVAA